MTGTESRLAARLAAALRVYEKANNECHNPAGTPAGGQFCGRGGATSPVPVPGDTSMGSFTDEGSWNSTPPIRISKSGAQNATDVRAANEAIEKLNPAIDSLRIVGIAKAMIHKFGQAAFERAGQWYEHRKREQQRLAEKLAAGLGPGGIPPTRLSVCGVAAALSPNTKWRPDGERMKDGRRPGDTEPPSTNWPSAIRICEFAAKNPEHTFDQAERDRILEASHGRFDCQSLVGKTVRFNDLSPKDATLFWPGMPRGPFGLTSTEKAIALARGADPNTTLGGFKVRNFFNNMYNPSDPRYLTVDTHALRIQTGNLAISGQKKGSIATKFFNNARLYGLAHASWTQAAARFGMTPSSFQAATWILWRRWHDKSVAGKKMNAAHKAAWEKEMRAHGYEFDFGIVEAIAGPGGWPGFLRGGGGDSRVYRARRLVGFWAGATAPHLVDSKGASDGSASGPGRTGRGLTEMARASGGTATSRQGKLVAPSTAPVTGPRASRRNFIRKVATILSKPPRTARLPRAAAPTAAKAPVGLLKPKRVG